MPDESVNCCVTSPPYWGLRNYGHPDQIGQESTPEEYVQSLRGVFAEVRRVLRNDGTCWLNLGDCYCSTAPETLGDGMGNLGLGEAAAAARQKFRPKTPQGLKPKDLVGIPWRVAFALQADGWWLRADIIWAKINCMPESVTDRPTKSHEYLFLLSKSDRYHYDAEAIKEPYAESTIREIVEGYDGEATKDYEGAGVQNPSDVKRRIISRARVTGRGGNKEAERQTDSRQPQRTNSGGFPLLLGGRNKRSVWTVKNAPYSDAHFATYPPDLVKPCVLAGCPVGGLVLDPFGGSGTTGMVALELGRRAVLIELNAGYVKLCAERCAITQGLPLAC